MQPSRRSSRHSRRSTEGNPSPPVDAATHVNPSTPTFPSSASPATVVSSSSRKRQRTQRHGSPPPDLDVSQKTPAGDSSPSSTQGGSSQSPASPMNPEAPSPPAPPVSPTTQQGESSNPSEPPPVEPVDETDDFYPVENRYEQSRAKFQELYQRRPELLRLPQAPYSARFGTSEAETRFGDLEGRKFLAQQCLSLTDKNLADVKRVVLRAGLIYTVCDSHRFQPTVVREFIANLRDAKERGDGVAVFVRGSLVHFSPNMINSLFCIPPAETSPDWHHEKIDQVCAFLTKDRVRRWEDMSSKYLTPTNQVLYKLVCTNWIPTTNYTTLTQDRLKLVYVLYHYRSINYGRLVFNQIMDMAENTQKEKTKRIIFPNLIEQILLAQRFVPPDPTDEDLSEPPRAVVKDVKAGKGPAVVSRPPNLLEDLDRAIASLQVMRIRISRGEYPMVPGVKEEPEDD